LAGIHLLARNESTRDVRFEDIAFGNRHEVRREHGKICRLAHLDAATLVFLKGGVGRRERQQFQRLLARDALFEMPVRISPAVERAPCDGGIELDTRIAGFDRRIGAGDDDRT
jgi:hypothetical protein